MHCSLTRAALEEAPIDQKKSRRYVTRYRSCLCPKILDLDATGRERNFTHLVRCASRVLPWLLMSLVSVSQNIGPRRDR